MCHRRVMLHQHVGGSAAVRCSFGLLSVLDKTTDSSLVLESENFFVLITHKARFPAHNPQSPFRCDARVSPAFQAKKSTSIAT